ncbi:MAG TPA: FAD-dependent oxidoreductase [Mycobacteriales bacterium]|nr:FAD-dependent oxidoreductase [Mycobacteriales bacterium]
MVSYWLDRDLSDPRPPLTGDGHADIVIIGAGFTGLWTAIELLERAQPLSVVICDADVVGYGASGRNGGFLDPSLTHGLLNGIKHFPDEIAHLDVLGVENYSRMTKAFADYGIDADYEPVGNIEVATRRHEVDGLAEWADAERQYGHRAEILDRDQTRELLNSPIVLGAVKRPDAGGVLDPAKLCHGLARAAEGLGAVIHEHTGVVSVGRSGSRLAVRTDRGTLQCEQVVLATNAYSGRVLRRTRRHFVPVYDYVLVSDPLTEDQRRSVGWSGREGISDSGNQFHYFRLTKDDRILWGGYDAVYYPGGRVGPRYDDRPETFTVLEANFRRMFPQLARLGFPYRWGGPIATTSRFTPVFGTAMGGRVGYALGYTGLGVATTCFAARILADMLLDPGSDLLMLDYVRKAPFPFPPEPLRTGVVAVTRQALARADEREGQRGPWLRMLDHMGIGFDS